MLVVVATKCFPLFRSALRAVETAFHVREHAVVLVTALLEGSVFGRHRVFVGRDMRLLLLELAAQSVPLLQFVLVDFDLAVAVLQAVTGLVLDRVRAVVAFGWTGFVDEVVRGEIVAFVDFRRRLGRGPRRRLGIPRSGGRVLLRLRQERRDEVLDMHRCIFLGRHCVPFCAMRAQS